MQTIRFLSWGLPALVTALWLAAEPAVFQRRAFFPFRADMVQYSGLMAITCMSVAMILALRLRWIERRLDGLDKSYRLHKWLGIGALTAGVLHWLWAKGPKWAVGWGWLERPVRGPRPVPVDAVGRLFSSLREPAEAVGEWAFYAAVALIVLALLKRFPYRSFFKTHRLLALAYPLLAFHAAVLTRMAYWASPLGLLTAVLLAGGLWSAGVVLLRRVAVHRQVRGQVSGLQYYAGVRMLEARIALPGGWPGHKAGQFAFATSDAAEGAHPYTIASAWNETDRQLAFIVKELGDHTRELRRKLRLGQTVTIEGPYGCFTFEDACPGQIWIGAGVGITPFIARMEQLAATPSGRFVAIDLFHVMAEEDPGMTAKVTALAAAAGVRLHLLIGGRDGRLDGDRIRAAVPSWSEASLWFCGPAGFGDSLRRDFAARGLPVTQRFHQELFAMR